MQRLQRASQLALNEDFESVALQKMVGAFLCVHARVLAFLFCSRLLACARVYVYVCGVHVRACLFVCVRA